MQGAIRQYVTAGVALLGAGVIAATPIAPTALMQAKVEQAVRLAAASIANIPANLAITIANTPANEVAAINTFADSLFMTGSWWVYTPTNVLGTDPADPPKLKSLAAMALPFGPGDETIGTVLGDQLNIIQEAEVPMNGGCTAIPGGCPDPNAILSHMFTVPLSELMAGYSFGTVINPTDGNEVPWSNTTVRLDPLAPVTSFVNDLMQTPGDIKTVGATDVVNAGATVLQGVWVDFYPFVPGSEIFNPDMTYLAYLFRPLAPILCGCTEPFIPPNFGNSSWPMSSAAVAPASPTTVPALDPASSASTVTFDATPAIAEPVSPGATDSGPRASEAASQAVGNVKSILAKRDTATTVARAAASGASGAAPGTEIASAAKAFRDTVSSGVSAITGASKPSTVTDSAIAAGTKAAKSADSASGSSTATPKSDSAAGKHRKAH